MTDEKNSSVSKNNTSDGQESDFKTPMMQQYLRIKKLHKDCLLLFRMGDFYELFMEDAEIASKILDITLTSRSKGSDGKIPMCGVPYHAVNSYLNRLIKAGYKAAICEQMSKPQPGKELVEREVVRIVTPGTVIDEGVIDENNNNYVLTFLINDKTVNLAYADISTGKFYVYERNIGNQKKYDVLINELKRINPNEIILLPELYEDFELLRIIQTNISVNIFPYLEFDTTGHDNKDLLLKFFRIKSLEIYGIENNKELIVAASFLLDYLKYTQKTLIPHITKITNNTALEHMRIDSDTITNLEIFHSNRSEYSLRKNLSLESTLNKTRTPQGSRMLKNWILYPLMDKEKINNRLNAVESFISNHSLRTETPELLKNIHDIERVVSKTATKTANARDLLSLSESLENSGKLINHVANDKSFSTLLNIKELLPHVEKCSQIALKISNIITNEPPVIIREGKMIRDGIDPKLDEIKQSIKSSKEWIGSLESREKTRTGITNLKVGYNSVFGYYIEITRANTKQIPENYIRKQTLVNAERYITNELKEKEDIVLNAEEKINEIEYELFMKLLEDVVTYSNDIQIVAENVAIIDVIYGFSEIAIKNNYTKPVIKDSNFYNISITEGRHPVVEVNMEIGEFSPNSTNISKNNFIHIITGPNMSGKSTYIRQIAIIQILAQIGSFVPAYKAEISISDGIYTRIGAGDALAQGLSTFMVEMIETAKILNNATENSLIVLDEVGRGTSTLDGLSIARAVVEFIYKKIGAKTLFATHFHELVDLDQRYKKVENYRVKVQEVNGEIRFMHRLEKGGTDKSYGVEVAKLAGVPKEVTDRAQELLNKYLKDQLKFDL